MFDKEKYYTIAIDNKNKAFIDRTQGQRDPEIIRIDNDVVKINLIVLEELSSSVSKRRAADLIIMDQVNKELQSGKLIQYHYYNDINDESDPLIDIREDIELPIIRKPYPRVTDIIRDETGELLYNSRNFINPGSKTRINTAQTPRNAYIFIPDDDGENGYAQSIPNLSYALKVKDVTENTTTTDLAETLQQN